MTLSAKEIIEETIVYYGTDPERRGVKKDTYTIHPVGDDGENLPAEERTRTVCDYVITNGETKYCAVGRCLTDEGKTFAATVAGDISELVTSWWREAFGGTDDEYDEMEEQEEFYLDNLLAEQYGGHSTNFWNALQHFHDSEKNWSEQDGHYLTNEGVHQLRLMAERFIPANEYNEFVDKFDTNRSGQ